MCIPQQAATRRTVLFLCLLPLIFFWRETLGLVTFGQADIVTIYFPLQSFAFEQLRLGRLPLWNPAFYGGMPLFGALQAGLLDPLNWLSLFGVTSRTLTLSQELSFVLSLLSTFAFARSLGMSRRAGVVAAVIHALNGFAIARSVYPGYVRIFALLPLALFFVERLYRHARWRDAACGALVLAWMVFAGHPQPAVYASLLVIGYALFCALARRGSAPDFSRRTFLLRTGAMISLGLALSAVQWIAGWEVASHSIRAQAAYEFFTHQSLHPLSLAGTLFPFFHGQGSGIYKLPHWGAYWTHNEAQFYLGVIALSLAIAGAAGLWREPSRQVKFWSAAALAALLCALGQYAPPVARALYHVPVLKEFRCPNRHWLEVSFAVAMLAGVAMDRLLRDEARRVARATQVAATTLAAITALTGAIILRRRDLVEPWIKSLPELRHLPDGFLRQAGAEFFVPIITAVCLSLSIILLARSTERWRWYPLVLALLVADYNLYAAFAPTVSKPHLENMAGSAMPRELAAQESHHAPFRSHLLLNAHAGEFNPFWFAGHEMATGYDPLLNTRYENFTGIDVAGRSRRWAILNDRDRTLDLLNVRYLLVPPDLFNPVTIGSGRVDYGGIAFAGDESPVVGLLPDQTAVFHAAPNQADTLGIVSTLANSTDVAGGDAVAEVVVSCGESVQMKFALRAGQHTAEWAFDREDVRRQLKHGRAAVAKSWPSEGFEGHSYLARFELPPAIARCESARTVRIATQARGDVVLSINGVAFHDSATGRSTPTARSEANDLLNEKRWREVALVPPTPVYGGVRVFENLQAMPRAWLAHRVELKTEHEQLRIIRGETGTRFDPASAALLDPKDEAKLDRSLPATTRATPGGTVTITERTPNSMLLSVETAEPAMLVLGEVAFPGWRAEVDGRAAELFRVNYLLRGVPVPAGAHVVEVRYQPDSLFVGAFISLASIPPLLLMLLAGALRRYGITVRTWRISPA
ncbi:MAG: YfhO family protein [Blastocatellia bacterium]